MGFLDPNHVLKQFGVYGTQDVADFGIGAGHISLAAARRLDGGRLYAVDLEKEMLSRLVSEAKMYGHNNVHALWGDASRPRGVPLADATLDRIIVSNLFHRVDDRSGLVQEVNRLLRPNGKVLFIEWKDDKEGGPHKNQKVTEDVATSFFNRCGFKKECNIDAGDYHYGIIFTR